MRRRIFHLVMALMALAVPMAAGITTARADAGSDLLGMVNNLRGQNGRTALSAQSTMTNVAQQWAQHMAATGTLAHNPNYTTQIPSGWTKAGENVGYGGSVAAVYNALVASAPHYANMVDPAFNLTGVGVATDSKGTVWVTEDFEAGPAQQPPPPPPPPSPASFTRPTNGAANVDTTVPFTWTSAPGAGNYYLAVGATQGGAELVNSGVLPVSQTSYNVGALPSGKVLWARIFTFLGGNWNSYRDVSFTAAPQQHSQATFLYPTNGATNVTTATPFRWTTVPNGGNYWLLVGTTQGGSDVMNTGSMPATQGTIKVPAMPAARTLWARIYTYNGGLWNFSDISFTSSAHP